MKNSVIHSGTIVSGVLASACCTGPLVLTFLGVGGAAFALALQPYRPYFIGLTALFLATGFYFAYRPQKQDCAPDEDCEAPQSRRKQRIMLWAVTLLTVILVAFPYLLPHLPM